MGCNLLGNLTVCILNFGGKVSRILNLLVAPYKFVLQCCSSLTKKLIIETNYVCIAAPIGFQYMLLDIGLQEILHNLLFQQSPIRVAPTIDALLHVSHNQVVVSRRHTLFEQGSEIVPLHGWCILKFINHEMIETRANFLIHKWRFAVCNYFIQ